MNIADLEHATLPKGNKRTVPPWVLKQHDEELAELRSLPIGPRELRVREVELEMKFDKIKNEIVWGEPCT